MRGTIYKHLIVLAFVLIALPTGVAMALLTPAGQVPDEQAHMARALGLLHGAVLGVRVPATDPYTQQPAMRTGLKVDAGLFAAAASPVTQINGNSVVTNDDFLAANFLRPDHSLIYVDTPSTASFFPATYLPATAGLAIGLATRASPAACFQLARLCMLATFLILGGLALWCTAYGEAVLLTILLLPMTLFLAGSVSQDAIVIAICCLVAALLTRNSRACWLAALLLFLPALLSHPAYLPLLVIFLLPLSRFGMWIKLRDLALACVPLVLWVVLVAALVAVPYPFALSHPGPLYQGDASLWLDHAFPFMNFQILLADPIRFVTLPWHTEQIWFSSLLREMVGVLGQLRIGLPMVYYYLWGVAAAVALLGLLLCPRPDVVARRTALTNSLVSIAAVAVSYWLIMIVFYVNFTDLGADSVTGLQGRYFLPLMPFLLFALPSLRLRFNLAPIIPAIPAMLLGLWGVGYLPLTIVKNYYLH